MAGLGIQGSEISPYTPEKWYFLKPHGGYREIDARSHNGGLIVSDKLRKH